MKTHKLLSLHTYANSRSTVIVSSPRWRKMESKIESPWREMERGKPCGSPGLISSCQAVVQCVDSSYNFNCVLNIVWHKLNGYIHVFICANLLISADRAAIIESTRSPTKDFRLRRALTRPEEASSEKAGNTWTLSHMLKLWQTTYLYREV